MKKKQKRIDLVLIYGHRGAPDFTTLKDVDEIIIEGGHIEISTKQLYYSFELEKGKTITFKPYKSEE